MFTIPEIGKSGPFGDLICREEIGEGVPISDILLFDGGHMAFILPFDALGVSFADFALVAVEGDAGTIIGDSISLENVGLRGRNPYSGKFFSLACIAKLGELTMQPEITLGCRCRCKNCKLAGE